MQLKATNEIRNLEEGRNLSLNSLIFNYYEPKDTDKWNEEYDNFIKQIL